jgi:hypothetical protein
MARVNAGHIRFLTQRAARSRAGFEAPSQRRDAGWPALGLRKYYPHIFRIVLFLLVNFWINEEQED